ncbi:hypothetical protein [Actinomadura nitritigenes]|uniref:hypothetical protein n=1 Tax=Actinomadura nitritigenes TaxID=134602 RepID=UPI003D9133FD
MTTTPTTTGTLPAPMPPEQIRDLEERAERVHPDEPVAAASEVLSLIRSVRDLDGTAVVMGQALGAVRALGREWTESRDLSVAGAGRILLALVEGRRGAYRDL